MATGQSIINDALTEFEAIAAGGSPSASESTFCLRRLNALIDSFSAQALPIPSIARESFTLTGAASYTIGIGQTFNTARPIKLESAAVTATNGARVPVRLVDVEIWNALMDSTRTGLFADILYYDNAYPAAKIYLAPAPTGGSLELFSYKPLAQLAATTDTLSLPQGYERMLVLSLAVEVAGAFGAQVTQTMIDKANDSKISVFGENRATIGSPSQVEPQVQTAAQ